MVVKKIQSDKAKNKAVSIRSLINYVCRAGGEEKLVYTGSRGFICEDILSQREEMVALACESARSKNPVGHYILSWKEGEQPTVRQVEQAVNIFLQELGLEGHQCIYGVHGNTNNVHLHIVVNRVSPISNKVVEINNGFDIEACHRAIAIIEHRQGWQKERNGCYQVLENGEVLKVNRGSGRQVKLSQAAMDYEYRSGEKSAQRIAASKVAMVIERARTWGEFHKYLADLGMRYERFGSGAVIRVGDTTVKASSVHRSASFSKLVKRFGEYIPAPQDTQVVTHYRSEPVRQGVRKWDEYIRQRKEYYARKSALKMRHKMQWQEMRIKQKEHWIRITEEGWGGMGVMSFIMRTVAAEHAAKAREELKERQRKEREEWGLSGSFPDFKQWLRENGEHKAAERWRYKDDEPQQIEGDKEAYNQGYVIGNYVPIHEYPDTYYVCKGQETKEAAFVDKGKRINVYDWRDSDALLAAMQLAKQKWGSFRVNGSNEYKAMCVKLAAKYGFNITNPELQDAIRREKRAMEVEQMKKAAQHKMLIQTQKPEQFDKFEEYARAINAERYRVTVVRTTKDGKKRGFVLGKRNGVSNGFTMKEVKDHIPKMIRLQKEGANIHLTPLSDDKYYIVIDDMTKGSLEQFLGDGHRPAVILETSPGNYQAIVTIPRSGKKYDREAGNQITMQLNKKYGDPQLSGCVHPHRFPGFINCKPKHRRPDGTYPAVKLVRAEQEPVMCRKTTEMFNSVIAKYQAEEATKQQTQKKPQSTSISFSAVSNEAAGIYQRHYRDILERLKAEVVDLSRIDAMIAVRLRVTGHNQTEIEGIIRRCAPLIRSSEEQKSRNWDDYARRTARYAFSGAGDMQTERLTCYRNHWKELEGQHSVALELSLNR